MVAALAAFGKAALKKLTAGIEGKLNARTGGAFKKGVPDITERAVRFLNSADKRKKPKMSTANAPETGPKSYTTTA